MTAKDVPVISSDNFEMPKNWSRERVQAVLNKYGVTQLCGDHLVPMGECGCKL